MLIKPVTSYQECRSVEQLAWEIIPEFYASYIPNEHNMFFVNKYLTADVVAKQIQNGTNFYLIVSDGFDVGFFSLFVDSSTQSAVLDKLYLLRDHRSKGYGSIVMNFILKHAVFIDLDKVVLTVNRRNARTIQFYRGYGFEISRELTNTFSNGHTVLDYEMTLMLV